MDGATLAEADGTPITRRPRRPIGIGRAAVVATCAAAIAVDLALRLLFVLPLWSGFASRAALPMTIAGGVAGATAFLLPTALVLRSPDAWQARRVLLLGTLLGAGSEIAQAVPGAVSGLNTLQVSAGADPIWQSVLPAAEVLSRLGLLGGVAGMLLFAFGLARLRERPAARSARLPVAVALVAVGLVGLAGLRPLVSLQSGVQAADWPWALPAVLAAGILATLCRAWVVLTGWSAGEAPRRAWTWAAAATCVGLATVAIGSLLTLGVVGLDPYLFLTVIEVVGIGGGLLFAAAVADGLGASPARE